MCVCLPHFSPYTLFWSGSQYGWCCNSSCWTDVTHRVLSRSPGSHLKNTQFQNTPESHISQIMNSMVVSILPLLGTSLPNRGLHTVKLEPGGAFDICDCFRDFIKMYQVCPEHYLQPWLPRTSACKSSTSPWPPCPWKKISQVLALFILLLVSFLFLTCCLLSVRVNCWSLDRVVHCQACQFLKESDLPLVQAISR